MADPPEDSSGDSQPSSGEADADSADGGELRPGDKQSTGGRPAGGDPPEGTASVQESPTGAEAGTSAGTGPAVDGRPDTDAPAPVPGTEAAASTRPDGWPGVAYDVVTSILAVLLIGGFLFAVSGVWPPLVAIESGSMLPNMHQGDLVFVMDETRFPDEAAVADTGVVPATAGEGTDYRTFGGYGDVIVFRPDGRTDRVPIIHRAMFWVEEDENWSDEVTEGFASTQVCERDDDPATDTGLENCPAPNAGFITKGDNNNRYDQVTGLSGPVKPAWVVGTAELRLPGLGWIRLGSP